MTRAMYVGGEPFFERPQVNNVLADLAHSDHLVVYCGAGVTIDQTGLNWLDLSSTLLTSLSPGDTLPGIVRENMPAQRIATVAVQRYKRVHGSSTEDRIADQLRVLLYDQAPWVSGDLVPSLLFLATVRRGMRMSPLTIVTTNYDTHIESAFDDNETEIWIQNRKLTDVGPTPVVRIYYLHGRVPKSGPSDGPIVLSEASYALTADKSRTTLGALFDDADVLVLGSSFTDPPLLNALQAHSTGKRFVLMPTQGDKIAASEDGRDYLNDVFDHYGCEGLFADYYGQVAQFVQELAICTWNPVRYVAPGSPLPYGARLDTWWREWLVTKPKALQTRQSKHAHKLAAALDEIRQLINAPSQEQLKLEMWVRWRPSRRKLRLWASSIGSWRDLGAMREEPIAAASQFAAVQAFCHGRSRLFSLDEDPASRWKTYLSVPVRIETAIGDHTAGVLVLASMNDTKHSSVSDLNRALLGAAVGEMLSVAVQLFSP